MEVRTGPKRGRQDWQSYEQNGCYQTMDTTYQCHSDGNPIEPAST
jgi:hypothetical protein